MVTMIAQMPDTPEMHRMHGQLRVVWATPFPPDILEIWKDRFGISLGGASGYGQTELGMMSFSRFEEERPTGASGRATGSFDIKVVDDDDREVPAGQSGEIVGRPRAPHVMFEGYWRRPVETAQSFRNLWYHTGDIGRMDSNGWLYFVDRKQDYLRRRGENISSFEMEMAILAHPDVLEVAIIGVPSEVSEDDVKVYAVLRDGSRLTEEDLCRWSMDQVPYYAVPRYIEFRQDLPRSPLGRVYKKDLRNEPGLKVCWDREAAGVEVSR
jgi:crotonobetaine/carnitine-CoA ligase